MADDTTLHQAITLLDTAERLLLRVSQREGALPDDRLRENVTRIRERLNRGEAVAHETFEAALAQFERLMALRAETWQRDTSGVRHEA